MIILVAAVSENGVIGNKGKIPWHIPEDMKRFKELTHRHAVLMGRKTYESIVQLLGNPLPERTNIVITRQKNYAVPPGVELHHTLDKALAAHQGEDLFVIGGGKIYEETIGIADKLYITHVEKEIEGDTRFPFISPNTWKLDSEERHDGYRFAAYARKA